MTSTDTIETLRRIAVHVVARARQQATGRFSLRVAPGGFGTPEFGSDERRVRVAGVNLVVDSDASGAAATRSHPIHGASLRELAEFAGVDLGAALDVGHDTPDVGDPDTPIVIDDAVAESVCGWYGVVSAALDRLVAELPIDAAPTLIRLWSEHFDVALDVQAAPGRRVNLGGSPGDGYIAEPYLYVGPWTSDRPGDPAFWNAPFGAAVTRSQLDDTDPVRSATDWLRRGYVLLE